MCNVVGKVIKLNVDVFVVVVVMVDWVNVKDFNLIMINVLGVIVWLIIVIIWVIMYKKLKNVEYIKVVFDFFKWLFENG